MAEIHGIPGEWARVKGAVLGLWPLGLGILAAGFSLALLLVSGYWWGSLLLAASVAGIAFSLARGMKRVESFYIGARGEERVSSILKNLPEKYHVFNDFVAMGTHVDHVVAGPAGVFAIETKFWKGQVTVDENHILVNGALPSRPPLKQVVREAALVRAALEKAGWSGCVTPVLAFAGDNFTARIAEVQGAVVLNACDLAAGFATERVVLPPNELERLVALMESNS